MTAVSSTLQVVVSYIYLLSPGYPSADFGIQLIYLSTAGSLDKIMLIPFETRDEEKQQDRIGHKNIISAIPPTETAQD